MSQYSTRNDGIIIYGLPANPSIGTIAVDSVDGKLKKYDGSAWTDCGSGGIGSVDIMSADTVDTATLSNYTQTGAEIVSTPVVLHGTKSFRLQHTTSIKSLKKIIPVDIKFRGKNHTVTLDVLSTATSGNLNILFYDETNVANLVASQSIVTNSLPLTATTANASNQLTGLTQAFYNTLKVGQVITGSAIPVGSTITALAPSTLTATISQNATGVSTGIRISDLVAKKTFSFDVPNNCLSLSWTISSVVEAAAESYIDDVVVQLTSQVLTSTSINIPVDLTPTIVVFSSGTGTYNPPANVKYIKIRMVGGGANGGSSITNGVGGGGGAGGYVEALINNPNSSFTYSIGVAGGNSTFVGGTTNLFAGGGSTPAAPAANAGAFGGAGGSASGGFLNIQGERGGSALGMTAGVFIPGAGASSIFSGGGYAGGTNIGTGGVATAYGSGGGGSANISGGGGLGIGGYIEITEYVSSTTSTTITLTTAQLVQQSDSYLRITGYNPSLNGSTATKIPTFTSGTIQQNIGNAIQYLDDTINGARCVALIEGIYKFSYSAEQVTTVTPSTTGFSLNSQNLTTDWHLIPANEKLSVGSDDGGTSVAFVHTEAYLKVGDIVRPHIGYTHDGTDTNYSVFTASFQGSLKQLNPSSDSKITIPTHQLRFEGASANGSTDTKVVKFDTQTITQGDAWDVVNTVANGTVVTMKKAGKLHVSTSLFASVLNQEFSISKNQAVLTLLPTATESLGSAYIAAAGLVGNISHTVDVKIGDKIRVISLTAINAGAENQFSLSLMETSIPANFSNVLPQWSQSDSSVRLRVGNGFGSTNTQIRRFSNNPDNLGTAFTYIDSVTLGGYIQINEDGIYNMSYSDLISVATNIYILKNSTSAALGDSAIGFTSGAGGQYVNAVASGIFLSKNDIIRVGSDGPGNISSASAAAQFEISKVGKPNLTSVDVTPFVNLKLPDTNIVGEVVAYAGSSIPENFLDCDGSAKSRTTYADLFNVIGTTYGVGDGSTTFNLPNLKGVFVKGAGSQTIGGIVHSGTLGTTENDQMQGHWHNQYVAGAAPQGGSGGPALDQISSVPSALRGGGTGVKEAISDGTNGTPRIGTETKPANVALRYIIRYMPNQTGIVTPTQQVSSDTIPFVFKATAINPAVDPIGTFNTYTYAANTNTATISGTAPTQTISSMNINGVQIFARAYTTTSTSASPTRFDIFIGEGLKSKQVDAFAGLIKTTPITYDRMFNAVANEYGATVIYSETTGIMSINAGVGINGAGTGRSIDDQNSYANGYFVFNASKSPSLVTIPSLSDDSLSITSVGNAIQLNMTKYTNFDFQANENTTFQNPINYKKGMSGNIFFTQNTGAAKTVAFGTAWKTTTGAVMSVSTTLGAQNVITWIAVSSSEIWYNIITRGVA